jgi:hypothetical protein
MIFRKRYASHQSLITVAFLSKNFSVYILLRILGWERCPPYWARFKEREGDHLQNGRGIDTFSTRLKDRLQEVPQGDNWSWRHFSLPGNFCLHLRDIATFIQYRL